MASSDLEPSSSADANKENTDPRPAPAQPVQDPAIHLKGKGVENEGEDANDGSQVALPPQMQEMLDEIVRTLRTFPAHPPHTMQRIAELFLKPQHHYKALASYLHALDRVVHVTSPSNRYPLAAPDSVPNGVVEAVSWGNISTSAGVGSDEALGGALLTPIPWLADQGSREGSREGASSSSAAAQQDRRPEIRTESTTTVEGPNGVGSIETVSISVNGIPSMTSTAGVTMRPVSHHDGSEGSEGSDLAEEEDEEPHVRGPDEIDAKDLGPHAQAVNINQDTVQGLQPQDIDIDAALGRKADSSKEATDTQDNMEGVVETGVKRGPEDELEGLASKKTRSEDGDRPMEDVDSSSAGTNEET